MDAADRPSALLQRLRRTSPLVTRAVAVAVASGLVVTAAIVVQALTLAGLLAGLFTSRHAGLAHEALWFSGATVVRALAGTLGGHVSSRVAAPVRRDLRRRLTVLTLTRGVSATADASTQLATAGVEAIESYLAQYVPALLLSVTAPVVLLGWLALRDPLSALIVSLSVALLPVFMVLLGLEARTKMHDRWAEQQRLADYFGDVVRGMTVLKSFNRSRDAVASLDGAGVSLQRSTMATLRVAFLSGFALELLSSLATALVALVLGLRLLNGSLGLNVALAVLLVTPEVFLPLRRSAAQFHASSNGIAAASELLARLDDPAPGTGVVAPGAPRIDFDGVVVAGSDSSLESATISATVAPGSLVVLRGPSGVGKSTVLRCVAGLATPRLGRVVVQGHDVGELDLAAWHRRLGWLPQDPVLVARSVGDAVRMGDDQISDERIVATLHQLELDLDLDRPLGEGAEELSAGQRRRLALARCLVRDPDVLLLDEPTAHLDAQSAAVVERVIARLTMTRIVASHRDFAGDQVLELRTAPARG